MYRCLLYWTFALLLATGAYWALLHDLALPAYVSEPALMKAHGAAAMAALVLVGALLPLHVPGGWRLRRNRSSGGAMLAICALLAVSGYLLYYAGDEVLREAMSYSHLALGLALPVALVLHLARRDQAGMHDPSKALSSRHILEEDSQ